MKLIKQLGIRSSQLLLICALCIYVIFSMTGMSVHKDRLRKVLRQETRQSNMAVPRGEGNSEVNGSLYRRDVGLPHELQPTEHLNTKERSTSLLPPSGDIYLGKQSLGALVRPDDMWVLEEPPNSTEPLSHVKLEELPLIKDTFTEPSQCPRTIGSVSRYSTWFNARYQEGVKIFLDFEDVRNYTVFRKLEHYGLPFGFRGQRRQQLADILGNPNFTNPRLFLPGKRPRCLSCAVVGSGGILNGSNAGKEIDSHDLVLRLNKADSRGRYAKDVGIKTSLYTFFPESMGADLVRDKNALFAFTMFKSFDVDYAEKMVNEDSDFIFVTKDNKSKKARKPSISPGRLKIVHPDFFRYVHSRYLDGKALRPTTEHLRAVKLTDEGHFGAFFREVLDPLPEGNIGALVVMMAVHLCDEVTIYGFGYDSRFSLHYYDQQFVTHNKNLTSCHDVHNELGLWQKLHEEGVIRFFHRDM